MNWETQQKIFEDIVKEEQRILVQKGHEYAGDKDALGNFKSESMERIGLTPLQTLWVYLHKHLKSIEHYIKHGTEFSEEPIEGRISDARNYLFLLHCLIVENGKMCWQCDHVFNNMDDIRTLTSGNKVCSLKCWDRGEEAIKVATP